MSKFFQPEIINKNSVQLNVNGVVTHLIKLSVKMTNRCLIMNRNSKNHVIEVPKFTIVNYISTKFLLLNLQQLKSPIITQGSEMLEASEEISLHKTILSEYELAA